MITPDFILRINIWRLTASRRVWYEWQAEIFDRQNKTLLNSTKIHNANGREYSIGL